MNYQPTLSRSSCIIKNENKKYMVKKMEDIVELRFDEENQVFYARIKNPSQHTQYLYNNNRLAVSLCKLNTGRSQRRHMGNNYWPGDRYWDEETQQWENTADFYVKKKYHPRWSRCRDIFVPVTDLEEEIEIGYDIYKLTPNQRHSLGQKWIDKWYTSIKAVLISSMKDLSDFVEGENRTIYSARSYKTMCKRIKVEYDSQEDILIHRKDRGGQPRPNPYSLTANVAQNGYNFVITITSMSDLVREAYNHGNLRFYVESYDCGRSHRHGGDSGRARNGDPDANAYKHVNRRWNYRSNIDKPSSRCQRVKQGDYLSSLTYSITLSPNDIRPPKSMRSLFRLVNAHNDFLSITKRLNLTIGMSTDSEDRTVWRYNTNINATYSSDGNISFSLVL